MPVASQVISPSNIPTPLSIGNDQGTVLGISATDLIAFYGSTPIAQPTQSGYTTLVNAGSTNALYADSTSTGGTGSTAYSVPGIIRALKLLGLIAS